MPAAPCAFGWSRFRPSAAPQELTVSQFKKQAYSDQCQRPKLQGVPPCSLVSRHQHCGLGIQSQAAARPSQQTHAATGHRESSLDREFWRTITLSPPCYGADTPHSFFDEQLLFGWNLRKLQCLLSQHNVPEIPGVTTPMTYFGMWKVRHCAQRGGPHLLSRVSHGRASRPVDC